MAKSESISDRIIKQVKILSETDLLEKKPDIKALQKLSEEKLQKVFIKMAEEADDAAEEKSKDIPETVADLYDELIGTPESGEGEEPEEKPTKKGKKKEEEEEEEEKEKEVKPMKKEKAKEVKKEAKKAPAKKGGVEKNKFGHKEGTKLAVIDEMLTAGTTAEAAAKKVGSPVAWIQKYIHLLKTKKGIKFTEDNGKVKVKSAK